MRNDDWTGGVRRTSVATRVRARGLDPRRRRGPDFVIIGAQRAGTTSLWRDLSEWCDDPSLGSATVLGRSNRNTCGELGHEREGEGGNERGQVPEPRTSGR